MVPIGAICLVLAIIITLPVPLGHMLPGAAISLLALGLLERDGLAIGIGLATAGLAFVVVAIASNHIATWLRFPARCGSTSRHARMNAVMTPEASGRLSASPPRLTGLSRKSPTVAPSGRVRMNAAQNSSTRETLVR